MEKNDSEQPLFPHLPGRLAGLSELAENLWWSWNPGARMLFKTLDRQAWKESGHNPDKMLRELPGDILEKAGLDTEYLQRYDSVMSEFWNYMRKRDCRLLDYFSEQGMAPVVYFSAEYGLHRSLPFYAGGLGFLAGDYIKECSDLCIPLVAVGFMYPGGYLRQQIRDDGWQEDLMEPINQEEAPISRVMGEDGRQLVITVPMTDPPIHVAVWKVAVGRVTLYLMDTDIDVNNLSWTRSITARLYIGDLEQRLRQEIVLGIGGAELLRKLGIQNYILHLNEGHAAFVILERIREYVQGGIEFSEACKKVINSTLFTTHTPVPAGHDVFPFQLMGRYFNAYWPSLGIERDGFMALGTCPDQPDAGFNMTAFALRLSGFRNGVSRRHALVSRKMWQGLWPDVPEDKVPIDYVTNGVHIPTWIEPKIKLLLDRHLGPEWIDRHDAPEIWARLDTIPDIELWQTHYWLKVKLIDAIRDRARLRWANAGGSSSVMLAGGAFLDPSVLTIGFARRFATYKRALLIFRDLERLKRHFKDRWRPIQIIFAGKAHPADNPGKIILQNLINLARDPRTGGRVAFVEDYGEQLAQYLVHGVDLWLNTPLPPLEACGTSGMKAALNGVPQLSILDGWWEEGFNGSNGWAVEHDANSTDSDGSDAEKIYTLLEQEIIPLYYRLSDKGIPSDWITVMKASMKKSAEGYSARRMVKEYVEKFYRKTIQARWNDSSASITG
ncbi:MAG: alpha-glucan family phosphorylase [Pseudomonadota bacterium]